MGKRIFYLDFLRGFAIIMVLILHSISGYIVRADLFSTTSWYANLLLNAFARTGVPIFFMISGCLILSSDSTGNFGEFYKKRLMHVAVPLVFWNIAYFVCKCIVGHIEFDVRILLSDFINCGSEYHLWYLYTLIGIYLIAPFLKILVDRCSMKQLVWLLVLMMLCTTIRPFINTVTPSGVYVYLFEPLFNGYIACFLMGYILSKINYDRKVVLAFLIAGVLAFAGSLLLNHTSSSSAGINLVANSGYSLCHYVLAAAIFVLSKFVFEKRTFLKGFTSTLARCSFGIYLIHAAVIDVVSKYFMIDASPIVSSAYVFVISFVVSFAISFLLGKIKYVKKIVL